MVHENKAEERERKLKVSIKKGASLVAQRLKCLPAMQETWVRSLGQEDPLEKEMATHFSILAWRIPWTEEPWWATVHGVAKSQTRLSNFTHSLNQKMVGNLRGKTATKESPLWMSKWDWEKKKRKVSRNMVGTKTDWLIKANISRFSSRNFKWKKVGDRIFWKIY